MADSKYALDSQSSFASVQSEEDNKVDHKNDAKGMSRDRDAKSEFASSPKAFGYSESKSPAKGLYYYFYRIVF